MKIAKPLTEIVQGLNGRAILFSDADHLGGDDLEALFSSRGGLYLAFRGSDMAMRQSLARFRDRVLDSSTVSFIDRVKAITGGAGFENVLVADESPESLRKALGVAAVLGKVYLIFPPGGEVSVDLHNTLLYKNLTIKTASPG